MVSKVRTTAFPDPPYYREVARYVSVTCLSDPVNGSTEGVVLGQTPGAALCADGIHGCCSRDEVVPGAGGGHQPVQVIYNRPSRVAVDLSGDAWVANRAHWISGYYQSSVTKIANNLEDCIDRNDNGVIDTSSDVDGDGIITTDCDDDDLPDGFDTVCTTGKEHEFLGLDDECILFTVNTEDGGTARALALAPGDGDPGDPCDAWVGMYTTGAYYRLDGRTGAIEDSVSVVGSQPFSAAIDGFGILWAPNFYSGNLYYFDTAETTNQGYVEKPGGHHASIAVDGFTDPATDEPIQQLWMAQFAEPSACRYRPPRNLGFPGLANGAWACATFTGGLPQGRGVAADVRDPGAFVWLALDGLSWSTTGRMARIPADIPDSTTTYLDPATLSFDTTDYGTVGAAVAHDGNLWTVSQDPSGFGSNGSVVHFTVDADGAVTGGPDIVPLDDKAGFAENFCGQPSCKPHPETFSDLAGFAHRNFTNPTSFYAWQHTGSCPAGDTRFLTVQWDADTPSGTAVTVRARAAVDPDDLTDAPWVGPFATSPASLFLPPGPLSPNPATAIELLFELTTIDPDTTPSLRSFSLATECRDDVLFADGFETGNTSAWSAAVPGDPGWEMLGSIGDPGNNGGGGRYEDGSVVPRSLRFSLWDGGGWRREPGARRRGRGVRRAHHRSA